MADTLVLETSVFGRAGSSPVTGTNKVLDNSFGVWYDGLLTDCRRLTETRKYNCTVSYARVVGIGRHGGLKPLWPKGRTGSNPVLRTIDSM